MFVLSCNYIVTPVTLHICSVLFATLLQIISMLTNTMPSIQENDFPVESCTPDSAVDKKNTSPPAPSTPEKVAMDEPFPFFGLLCYADALDWMFMVLGTMGSLVHGMAPSMSYYILGKTVDAFGNNINDLNAMVHEFSKVTFYPE